MWDSNGIPIRTSNDNPLLDSRSYEVEYLDRYKASLSANEIDQNLFAQVDEDGKWYVLYDQIIDHRKDDRALKKADGFIQTNSGGRRKKETTIGWELLVQWKDGSSTWEKLKDMKECYPIQTAKYTQQSQISDKPAFAWWTGHVLKKHNRILAKIKSKYWTQTHKFGIRIPKSVKEARKLDSDNGNTLWWDAIMLEMKNVRIAFEEFDGEERDIPPGFQEVNCHLIFNIKMGENFCRKVRMIAGGHITVTSVALTYSSVVSRDSVCIVLTIAALNDLKILSSDIQNAYLAANCKEKIWCKAGPEFGAKDCGKIMLITCALYGLKSSGAAFRNLLADKIGELGYRPSKADHDVWLRPAVNPNGDPIYEYIMTYADDVIAIGHGPMKTMKGVQYYFKFKDDKIEEPDIIWVSACQRL